MSLLFLCFHSEYGDTLRREAAESCKSWETIRLPDYQQGTLLVQDSGLSLFIFAQKKLPSPSDFAAKMVFQVIPVKQS